MDFKKHLQQHPIFGTIGQAADELGLEAYVIGGYVRDLMLERPNKDIDVVCIGSGIDLAQKVAEKLGDKTRVNVYRNFGTAQIPHTDYELEFVGARKESYRKESRKPVVEDGTLEDDQNRRDFTINAMGLCLNSQHFGVLLDPFDGQKHLQSKLIKTPLEPGITFSDDPLRMMRAIRFATQLNFDIDPVTFQAIADMKDRITIVSQERITDELNKIILAPTPSYGFKLLDQTGLLEIIFPDLVKLKGVEYIEGKGHKDNFYHTLQVLDNITKYSDDLWVRWAAILHDIAKPATKRFHKKAGWTFHGHEEIGSRWVKSIFRKMKLPLDHKMRTVKNLVRLHLRPIALAKEGVTDSALRRVLVEAGDDIEKLLMLCRADITSKDPNRVRKYLKNFDKVEQLLIELEQKDKLRNFQPVITGEIIMQVFDLSPSKEVGLIKSAIREAVIDGDVANTLEDGYAFIKAKGEEMGFQVVKTLEELVLPEAKTED
ncbi:CCA tRNA nucleotidyltransferase [Jiulongibacter sp. NS-SX5]|uniref:CCA tRNA nucleotidyltransferase n=1 Tax=Jiulongibacter sp. NS-SX5 TaxID=3463854 RepID=UPI004059DC8E